MLNEYTIRHLNINDTDDMYSCIMRSYASMKNKEYFIHPTKEYLFEILCGKGKSYGTHHNLVDDYYNFIKNIWLR